MRLLSCKAMWFIEGIHPAPARNPKDCSDLPGCRRPDTGATAADKQTAIPRMEILTCVTDYLDYARKFGTFATERNVYLTKRGWPRLFKTV